MVAEVARGLKLRGGADRLGAVSRAVASYIKSGAEPVITNKECALSKAE
jgi:hypothetical protein